MDLTLVAYATLALSVFVSAVKMGGWILNADPRAIIGAGRWALALLPALALAVLVWLVASGRWTAAMLLAAFLLPVFVQAAPRWRVLFSPLNAIKGGIRPFASDLKVNGSGNGGLHMSTQEAFDVLGLEPTPSPREIKAAHRRLAQLVDPEQGGSHYLLTKIDEARDVLLGE